MLRRTLILLLTLALLLPKATATLAVLLPGSFTSIVICTGSEVQMISLDHRGEPVENAEIHGLECLSEAASFKPARPDDAWQVLHRAYDHRFRLREAVFFTPAPEDAPSLGRAPPAAILSTPNTSLI